LAIHHVQDQEETCMKMSKMFLGCGVWRCDCM
jgi:hypothetical protein